MLAFRVKQAVFHNPTTVPISPADLKKIPAQPELFLLLEELELFLAKMCAWRHFEVDAIRVATPHALEISGDGFSAIISIVDVPSC